MSESLGDKNFHPSQYLPTLYQTWANGGAGLLITGNVMCDSRALGEPGNVVVEKSSGSHERLAAWAKAGTLNGTHLWMQINHPGRQSPKFLSTTPVAPSAIALKPPLDKMFNRPRALEEKEIFHLIARFGDTAELAQNAGFTGVQIHGAHGYLVAQFLSPLSNQRTDNWGGSLENRMRFVLKIYREIRKRVGKNFPVSIKLNSADFQRGGFSEEESLQVIQALDREGLDLFEISGGSYESQVMMKGDTKPKAQKESTQKREAYFLDFAAKAKKQLTAPLMLTGGFRSSAAMTEALQANHLDVIGLARALALDPEFPKKLLQNQNAVSQVHPLSTGVKWLDNLIPLEITWYSHQLHRMGKDLPPRPNASVVKVVLKAMAEFGWQNLKRVRA